MVAAAKIFGPNRPMHHCRTKCRIYLAQPMTVDHETTIPADQTHYLRHVMRLVAGDPITLFNGEGGEFEATITHLDKQGGSCGIDSFRDVNREMPVHIHIIQCANKNEKIEMVLQKATELGAASFQVASSERSQFKLPANKLESRLARWQKIIIEAAEQSERTAIPELAWQPTLEHVETHGTAYALHPEGAADWQMVRESIGNTSNITLAIGPEGGFSQRDLESLEKLGFKSLTFGPRVMRTETAAPALAAAIQAIL